MQHSVSVMNGLYIIYLIKIASFNNLFSVQILYSILLISKSESDVVEEAELAHYVLLEF